VTSLGTGIESSSLIVFRVSATVSGIVMRILTELFLIENPGWDESRLCNSVISGGFLQGMSFGGTGAVLTVYQRRATVSRFLAKKAVFGRTVPCRVPSSVMKFGSWFIGKTRVFFDVAILLCFLLKVMYVPWIIVKGCGLDKSIGCPKAIRKQIICKC